MISFFCFALVAAILFVSLWKRLDILSPGKVFVVVWAMAIGLAELKLSGFQHHWSPFAWITLLIGITSFLVGILVVNVSMMDRRLMSVDAIRDHFQAFRPFREISLVRGIVLLGMAYIIAYAAEVVLEGSVPLFARMPDRARVEFGVFGLHLIVNAAPAILILCGEYFVLIPKPRRYGWLVIAVFLLTFVTYGFLLQRFNYFLWAVVLLVVAYYGSRLVKPRYLLIAATLFVLLVAALQGVRLSRYVTNYLYIVSKMRYPMDYALFTEPYMYVVMNLENFARGVDRLADYTWGIYTFDPLFALSGLKHWMTEYFLLVERPFLVSGYNTFPFLWTYYRDFGVLGIGFFPFVLAVVCSVLYFRFRMAPHVRRLILYGATVFVLVFSFFVHAPSLLNFVFNAVILLFIHRQTERRPLNGTRVPRALGQ